MKRKVIINKLPQADSGLSVKMNNLRAGLGFNANKMPWSVMAGQMSEPDVSVKKQLGPVPREFANLEAEKGETAMIPNKDGIPSTYTIGGKRHSQGGTPLNLPKDSFIFSDTAKMKIKDPEMLKRFGMPVKKGGYTPAEIAKKYDISAYKKILADKNSDKLQKETAERMIQNYNMKLAELALLQESMKGFPQGIPLIAMPYIIKTGFDPSFMFQPQEEVPEESVQEEQYQEMEEPMNYGGIIGRLKQMKYGGLQKFQNAGQFGDIEPGEKGVFNAFDGTYTIFNKAGKPKRIIQIPANILSSGIDLSNFSNLQKAIAQGINAQNQQQTTTATTTAPATTETKPAVVTSEKPTTKNNLPEGAIVIKSDEEINLDEYVLKGNPIGSANIYKLGTDGKYYKAVDLELKDVTPSGFENYTPVGKTYEEDITRANDLLNKLQKSGKATYKADPTVPGGKRWTIYGDAEEALTLDEQEFLTRMSSVGSGVKRDNSDKNHLGFNDGKNNGFTIVTQSGKNSKGEDLGKGTFGWANPEYLEYQYWKQRNPNNYSKSEKDWKALTADEKATVRKNFLRMHGFDVDNTEKYKPEDFKKEAKQFYTKKMITGTGAEIKKDSKGKILNGEEIGLVGASQELFGTDAYRPGLADDYKLGLEHLDIARSSLVWQLMNQENPSDKTKESDEEDDEVVASKLKSPNLEFDTPWWLQDIIKTANAASNYANIKKYYPWQAEASVVTPDVTFYDPTRELAAAAEQSAIAANQLGQFTGPQAFNARYADLQAKQAENAANILSRYNNLNVGISNQQAAQNAATYNQAAQQKALRDTSLWDKYQTLNQQFDISKSQAKDALVTQYANAITNRAYTANLNTLTPQYAVDPSGGGFMRFRNPRELEPEQSKQQDFPSFFTKLQKEIPAFTNQPDKLFPYAIQLYAAQTGNPSLINQKSKGIMPITYPGTTGDDMMFSAPFNMYQSGQEEAG